MPARVAVLAVETEAPGWEDSQADPLVACSIYSAFRRGVIAVVGLLN